MESVPKSYVYRKARASESADEQDPKINNITANSRKQQTTREKPWAEAMSTNQAEYKTCNPMDFEAAWS